MREQIRDVLMHHGFIEPQADARSQIEAAAEGLVGMGRYDTLDELYNDIENHGELITPRTVTADVAALFWTAVYGTVVTVEPEPFGENEFIWYEV